jgi:Flp pilus assembly protein TadG
MRILLRLVRPGRDDGAVAVLVAVLAVVLVGMAAFAVDFGNAYAVKRQLSVAADADALAAGQAVNQLLPAGSGCNPSILDSIGATSVATAAAITSNTANDPSGQSTVDSVTVDCDNTAVTVTVANSRVLQSIFGGIFGVSNTHPTRQATARVFVPITGTGLRPIAACMSDVTAALNATGSPGDHFVAWISREKGVCGTSAPGNWGYTNFLNQGPYGVQTDPAPSCNGNSWQSGSNEGCQSKWIQDGYGGPVYFPDANLSGNTGLVSATKDEILGLIGQTIQLPVGTALSGTGNNATINAVGYVSVTVCGVNWKGNVTQGSCWLGSPATLVPTAESNEAYLQVKIVKYFGSTSYNPDPRTGCLANPSCDFGTRVVALYK